jgi:ankyrin repeat protein
MDMDAKGDVGRTALHWEAENGHEANVGLLLE